MLLARCHPGKGREVRTRGNEKKIRKVLVGG
jgi:hypothetical protein